MLRQQTELHCKLVRGRKGSGDAYRRGEDIQSLVVTLKRILTYFRRLQNAQKLVKVRTFLINKIHSYFSDNLEISVKFFTIQANV